MQSPEALHIQGVLRLAREAEIIGARAERVLRAAARQQARRIGSTGPATQQALIAQLAVIQQTLEQAGFDSYAGFVEDMSDSLWKWTSRDSREVTAAVQSALDQGIQLQTAGSVGPAAGIAVTTDVSQQVLLSRQALQTVSRMGPLELAIAGSSKQPYSLGREFANAFMSPDARSLRQNWGVQVTRLQDIFEQEIRGAVLSGGTGQDIVQNLLGGGGQVGRLQAPLNQVKTLARTGALSTANAVSNDQLQQNTAVQYVRYLATLDQRTSEICRSLDGEIFKKDDAPRPPLHFNCRSTLVAYTPGRVPGSRSMTMAVPDGDGVKYVGAYDPRYQDRFTQEQKNLLRANDEGKPPKYTDWLAAQPADAQRAILGRKNAETYRNTGSLTRATSKATKAQRKALPKPVPANKIRAKKKGKPLASPVTSAPPSKPGPPPGSVG